MPEYGYFLSRVMQPVAPDQGASGYFASPDEDFDPALFEGDRIRPDIRQRVLNLLYEYWRTKYHDPERWSTAWIAGSAISYQWSADRGGLGDLDILIGVDYPQFYADNPDFTGFSPEDLSAIFNRELHDDLWPSTAEVDFNGHVFEVTFYVNPNSTDIRDINPYAAYDLTHDSWTVRPPTGSDFDHPDAYYKHAEDEAQQARALVGRYNSLAGSLQTYQPGTPAWHNTMRQAELLVSQASTLYDQIHLGRKQAFSSGGSGYGDYYNFRWQYHKKQGTAQALNGVAKAHKAAQEDFNTTVYGRPIEGADVILRRAAMHARGMVW